MFRYLQNGICLTLISLSILYAASGIHRLHNAIKDRNNKPTPEPIVEKPIEPTSVVPQNLQGTWIFFQKIGPEYFIVDFSTLEKGTFHRIPSENEDKLIESVHQSLPPPSEDLTLLALCYLSNDQPAVALFTLSDRLQKMSFDNCCQMLSLLFTNDHWKEAPTRFSPGIPHISSKSCWTKEIDKTIVQTSLIGESPHRMLLLEYGNSLRTPNQFLNPLDGKSTGHR